MGVTKFKLARLAENKKQMDLAMETGISISVLSQIENGWLKAKPHQLKKLEEALPKLRVVESLIE